MKASILSVVKLQGLDNVKTHSLTQCRSHPVTGTVEDTCINLAVGTGQVAVGGTVGPEAGTDVVSAGTCQAVGTGAAGRPGASAAAAGDS